jgi:hypothetical protein
MPTREQQMVLDTVAPVYLKYGQWPTWAWLEETLDRQSLSASEILAGFPREFSVGYGYLWPTRQSAPTPQDRVGLTVAGLAHVEPAEQLVSHFLNLVDALGTIRAGARLDPFSETRPTFNRDQVMADRLPATALESLVVPLLAKEPATWHCVLSPVTEFWETVELSPEIRRFAGVRTVEDYLERLRSYLSPVEPESTRLFHSPFTLPAAIDYLDTVWQLRFDKSLVVAPGVERSGRLAFDAASPEEADSCLSALAELLKGLQVPGMPGIDGHPLQRLAPFLEAELPAEAHPRIRAAVAVLDSARSLRAGAQHVEARAQTIDAYGRLHLAYPVADWSAAWRQIQLAVADACDAIRDELQAN